MQDIAIATGGQFISEEVGVTLEAGDLTVLGSAKKVIITKDDTIIMGGAGGKNEVTERVDTIREQIDGTTSEYDKEKL
jgi:chaperonin GroEL